MASFSIIDTHTHGYFPGQKNPEAAFDRARKAGVMAQIHIGCDEQASFAALELAQKNKDFYSTVGLHPSDVFLVGKPDPKREPLHTSYVPQAQTTDELFGLFDTWIMENPGKIVGVGECGFDFYHDDREKAFKAQEDVFLRHLKLAQKHNLPLIIHTRNAIDDMIEFFKKHILGAEVCGVVHCFSEDMASARFFTEEAGFYLGIGGIVTYKNADVLRDVVRNIPLEKLITETDAPFLPPQEFRKKNLINEPAALVEIVEKIAEVRGEPVEQVAEQLVRNAQNLYRI